MCPNIASTQYGDAKGTVSIDWHSGSEIHEWARDLGVPENFFPLGLSLRLGEMHPQFAGREVVFSVTIYAADTAVVGETAKEIINYAQQHGRIPVKRWDGVIAIEDMPKYIKRFNIVAKSRGIVGDTELVVEEE